MIIVEDKLEKTISGESVNFVETPNKEGIIIPEYIIIHFTAGHGVENTINWFKEPTAKASVHVNIDNDGRITQMVEFNKKAWHAGRSRWADRSGFNDFSISIELENPGKLTKVNERYYSWFEKEYPKDVVVEAMHKHENTTSYWHSFTERQIESCFQVCKLLTETYNIKDSLGHDDIAPIRKNDPGPAFPMERLRAKLLGREDDTADMYNVVAELANVRKDARTESDLIGKLKKNTPVEFIKSKLGWFYVYVLMEAGKDGEPVYGWINSDLLEKV